ncbi:2-amino-4-hydroxy-6-hydroxymethyldihydropteridine diphosphokinase [Ferrimicrobium acidiphilum]|uniref:2-amino-4-hydroxy-6- hydroxymethyldihydropteridine diphosphokinase n=1 Tax=Ferrimicrobium acidiphilum TaxID=121039 RepID=UPI0023F30C6A|nr:2-amino-4-hydroxy-6-hydroxymethyldihydropteridine diphosphokinase [Ferrimicrobium acidiphilum]MCL5053478.1 2-amino-4-hydroxy-6-hydroxymethyldihydropteridine diphosphokinase [Gammaproteobacteria bacterium]
MKVYLGLGANLVEPQRQMEGALELLGGEQLVSSLYRTAPVGGPPNQPDYLNAVMAFQWHRSPFALLALIHRIEAAYGRERQVRFGPRTLDIDILAISGLSIKSTELTLPHPRVAERAFVLVPLAEVDVDLAMKFGYVGGYPDEVVKVADFDTVGSRWV